MSKNSSVIEINGKRYDAFTGKLIGAVKKIAQPAAGASLDGFTKAKTITKTHIKRPATTIHKKVQKSKTLMRGGVKKPDRLKSIHRIINSKTIAAVSPGRLSRAANTHRSSQVHKYAHATQTAAAIKKQSSGEVISPTPLVQNQGGIALRKPLPSMVTSVSHQRLERLLDEALAKADSHKQMLKQLQKRGWWHRIGLPKWLSLSAIAVLAFVAAGIFTWQKVPQVSLKFAAGKAKIGASVPAYKPDGFSVSGPVKYESGAVVLNYTAGGNQSYTLSQKASDWDSVSLAANAIPSNTPVQTSLVKGTTVYIYGQEASWVSNGIRYNLTNKANLSSDQIIKIAGSL